MTEHGSKEIFDHPTPLELPLFVPHACTQLLAPFAVRVDVQLQDEYVSKTADDKPKRAKSGKSTMQHHTSRTFDSPQKGDESGSVAVMLNEDEEQDTVISLVAVYDTAGHLVELGLHRACEVPRLLLKVLALCVPFHPALHRLAVRWGPLRGVGLYEIAKLLPLSQITEICLDDSPVPECNYYLLLEEPTHLSSLSLARCKLEDCDCEALAARLHHPRPAARTLHLLSLAANRISDAGAAALAAALRSNRVLQYLNLSGNRITDEGAASLLGILMEFPLTGDELIAKRRRMFEYLKLKDELTKKCYAELAAAEKSLDELSRSSKRRQTVVGGRGRKTSSERRATLAGPGAGDPVAAKTQLMVAELVGAYSDPFGADETVSRDRYEYSMGNLTLCALNLAYNELGWTSVVKLQAVLRYQEALGAAGHQHAAGLLRVVLEGNALPAACPELQAVQDLLDRALAARLAKPTKLKHERSTGKAKSK